MFIAIVAHVTATMLSWLKNFLPRIQIHSTAFSRKPAARTATKTGGGLPK